MKKALVLILMTAAGQDADRDERLARHRNLGKAFFENPTTHPQAVQEFRKALALAPASTRERLNVGLALLANGQTADGIAELEKVQKQDASIPHTWFNLGVQYKRTGDYERSQQQFEGFLKLVPDEPVVHYNLGTLHKLANRTSAAIQAFEKAMELDPNLAAPHFQLYNLYRQAGRRDDAARQLQLFQKAKDQQGNAAVPEDMEWSFYSEILDVVDAKGAAEDEAPAREWKFFARRLSEPVASDTGGMLVMDAEGDGRPDLLAWPGGVLRLFVSGAPSRVLAEGVEYAAAGDANNDGFADLCAISADGAALWMNVKGRFTRKPLPAPSGRYRFAVWLDYDHDYDLDLLLFGERNALLRNQGDSGFADRTSDFPFQEGNATAAAAFRLVADSKGFDLAVSYRDRPGVLYQDKLAGVYQARVLPHLMAGARLTGAADADHNGLLDLLYEAEGKAYSLDNLAGLNDGRNLRFRPRLIGDSPAAIDDWENRSVLDAVAGGKALRLEADGRYTSGKPVVGVPAARALASADFNLDGRADLAVLAPDGSVHLLTNLTVSPNPWLRVGLAGVKNLKLAYGAEVEVKAGKRYQKKLYAGYPLLFGLRGNRQADAVRITWPNGLIQNEANQLTGRTQSYKEAQRLSGSCPQVWTWNGREFEYITDVLGVAPLGASAGDGRYFPVDHREHIQIPGSKLRLKDGAYEVRLTEELSEVAYLDQVQLLVFDHPARQQLFVNEKFQSPPYPDLRVYAVEQRHQPVKRTVAPGPDGWSYLELDFGTPARGLRSPLLVLHGWVDWADGSVFRNRSQQRGRELVTPFLQVVEEAAKWRTVIEDMGMPAGKPKWIAVELDGRFLTDDRKIRIGSNLALHWKEAFLAESITPEIRQTVLTADHADLRFRGFSRVLIHPERREPEKFLYAEPLAASMWNPTPGMYTRYGDVRALVDHVDDRLVIMGSGDEVTLRFPASGLPAVPVSWERNFVLAVDGWAKDRDPNTAYSQSVEPLPFHGMSQYPYPVGEKFPDGDAHRTWRGQYNTRPALRLIRPLREN